MRGFAFFFMLRLSLVRPPPPSTPFAPPCRAGLGWAGLGWAGLSWAGLGWGLKGRRVGSSRVREGGGEMTAGEKNCSVRPCHDRPSPLSLSTEMDLHNLLDKAFTHSL